MDMLYENNKLIYEYKSYYLTLLDTSNKLPSKLFIYDLKNDICLYGDCQKYNTIVENFKNNYEIELKN